MHFSLALAAMSALALSVSASSVVWVTETAYTCPCSSSSLSTTTSANLGPTLAKTTAWSSSRSTPVYSSFTSTTSGPASCIPLGGDCTHETGDYYCCGSYTCDVGLDIPTCVSDDSNSYSTTTSSATTSSTSPAGTCIPLGGDCTNETDDYYCCGNYSCDVSLDTPTCVSD